MVFFAGFFAVFLPAAAFLPLEGFLAAFFRAAGFFRAAFLVAGRFAPVFRAVCFGVFFLFFFAGVMPRLRLRRG